MRKFISNKYTIFALGLIFFLAVWWIISLCVDTNSIILPSPIETFKEAFRLMGDPYTYICLGKSLLRMLIGFLISFVIAAILSLIVNGNEKRYQFFAPTMTFMKAVPTVALVFLFIVISGAEDAPIFVVVLIALPIIYEAMVSGLKSPDRSIIEAAKVDGANEISTLFKIKVPIALPYIIVGVVSSFSLSFKVEIMSEVVTGFTKNGLGSLIKATQVSDPTNMITIFGYSLIAVVAMLIITLVIDILKKTLIKKEKVLQRL